MLRYATISRWCAQVSVWKNTGISQKYETVIFCRKMLLVTRFEIYCRLMDNIKIIMSGPLFFQLLVYAVFIAVNLLQLDEVLLNSAQLVTFKKLNSKNCLPFQTLQNFDFGILLNLNSLITQIIFNYISCSYANNVTVQSLSAADIAFSVPWYAFPMTRQHFIMQMIQRAQKPFYLKGYNIVECSLATYFNVNSGWAKLFSICHWFDKHFFALFSF